MAERTFTVDVDWTDRTRSGGRFTTFTHRASVAAFNDTEAACVAAQLVACCIGPDDMVIATRVLS